MRKHGWQLPHHPLQVVAIAVFLALGFAFYVFFVPFVGKKQYEIVVMGLYTPLVACVFFLYIWCAAADPGDPGVFKSKKYLSAVDHRRSPSSKKSMEGVDSISSSVKKADSVAVEAKSMKGTPEIVDQKSSYENEERDSRKIFPLLAVLCFCSSRSRKQFADQESSEDGMFYCSLCEVEVHKYSKHCRVCDKCVDGFDHHCRWINNCIGKKNYSRFFILMMSALLLLVLQFSIGVLVLVRCFLERHRFSVGISSKLGSSFSLVPFLVVVGSCTFLAMAAALPIAQLFFFHVLLIKKGISTYDYIVALREQAQQEGGEGGHQSPQMTPLSSLTGLSSASSFTNFRRASWCTPPRLFLEDQFDVVPPRAGVAASSTNKRNPGGTVKISPWTLARLDADQVSKMAAQARSKSRAIQPASSRRVPPPSDTDGGAASRKRPTKRRPDEGLANLAPLQLEARHAFISGVATSSPDSSVDSPAHVRQFDDGGQRFAPQMSRSTSDGYDASGGEDSDRVPSRIVHRSSNWSNFFGGGESTAAALTGSGPTSIRVLRPEFGEDSGRRH